MSETTKRQQEGGESSNIMLPSVAYSPKVLVPKDIPNPSNSTARQQHEIGTSLFGNKSMASDAKVQSQLVFDDMTTTSSLHLQSGDGYDLASTKNYPQGLLQPLPPSFLQV